MLQIEAAPARRRTDTAAAAMQLHAPALALLALLALCGAAQARPEGSAPADAPSDVASTPTPRDASHEADVDNSSSSEEDNMTVQGKAAALCPPRQPELLAIEAECAQDEHTQCSTTPAPTSEAPGDSTEAGGVAPTTEAATATAGAAGGAGTTETPPASTESTPRQGRKQRKRSCNYHLCVLKKLEVLDSSDMPDKTLLTNWIASNVTDEKQREKLQQRFTECVTSLKDIFGESSENSKSNEEETTEDKKNEETQPKKKSCVTAKKVISCLSKSVECPVLKF